jgi:three-Cys-motif partner protein
MALPAVKRELLVRYLDAWAPAALHGTHQATYVEGYAGLDPPEGSCAVAAARVFGEFADLLAGHRLTMLLAGPDAAGLDRLDRRLAEVRAEFGDPAGLTVQTAAGSPGDVLAGRRADARGPLFGYLDSVGAAPPELDAVAAVARRKAGELLIVLDPAALLGFAEDPEAGDRFFGGTDWRSGTGQRSDAGPPSGGDRYPALVDAYRDALRRAGFGSLTHVELVEDGGAAELLVFATGSAKNADRLKDAFWAVDEYAGVRYRDPRDAEHELLDISLPPHVGPLRRALLDRARRTGRCTVAELREYAVAETIYRTADATRVLTALLGAGSLSRQPEKGRLTPETVLRPAG